MQLNVNLNELEKNSRSWLCLWSFTKRRRQQISFRGKNLKAGKRGRGGDMQHMNNCLFGPKPCFNGNAYGVKSWIKWKFEMWNLLFTPWTPKKCSSCKLSQFPYRFDLFLYALLVFFFEVVILSTIERIMGRGAKLLHPRGSEPTCSMENIKPFVLPNVMLLGCKNVTMDKEDWCEKPQYENNITRIDWII